MSGIKNFILGFSLSLSSIALGGQLYFSAPQKRVIHSADNIRIDLFKSINSPVYSAQIPPPAVQDAPKAVEKTASSNTSFSTEGEEDDEILSINIDGAIPIDFSEGGEDQAEILYSDNEDMSAMLPLDTSGIDTDIAPDSPWVIAKGSKHIKNKILLEQFKADELPAIESDDFKQALQEDKEISYKVAEKIKQSIIFPIPDEILNDENLTPTFIRPTKKSSKPSTTAAATPRKESLTDSSQADDLKILSKKQPEPMAANNNSSKGIINSISSWFSDTQPAVAEPIKKVQKKSTPTYSSQESEKLPNPSNSHEDLADFYESLQETKREYANKIMPSELKLSFRPGRAEISGSTLRWLKEFSETTHNSNTILQVRLDASASAELQKKRLTLLYTIFMKNNADFDKISTIFSATEPNTFIISIIKLD